MLDRLDDTIVAISSAAGHGPLGIVRLSGPRAITIADSMTTVPDGNPLGSRPGSTRTSGEVMIDSELSLPAWLYLFLAPRSYTRQDMVEVHTVGSPAALELVRQRAIELGAVPAEPGEFTARAFLNGAMDLGTAEAVAGVIRAQTDTQLRASRRMMDGTLAKRINDVRDELAELLGLVEADIDFAEEPIDFITPAELGTRVAGVARQLEDLVKEAVSAERFEVLPHILLLGPPNVGKSSLMNRLSGTSRAICAAVEGTTRDVLSAPIKVGRGEAILLDAAGVRQSEDDIIARAGDIALSTARQVDLVCLVVDITQPDEDHVFKALRSQGIKRVVVAANKCDVVCDEDAADAVTRLEARRLGPVCPTSALVGTGVEDLRDAFAGALGSAVTTTVGQAMLISERQRASIKEASEALARALSLAETATETIDCADLLAFELREALDTLGTVTGQVTTEDLLGQVFANFCIGK